jgi:hypothetical protein
MTHVSIVTDPVYLTEPLIKSQDFVQDISTAGLGGGGITTGWLYPCEYVDEAPGRPRGQVPSYMPGENLFVSEFANHFGIPSQAALGGAETMYPEYQHTLSGVAAKK